MSNEDLIARATELVGEFPLSEPSFAAGGVAAALLTEAGNVYTGICLDLACGIGFRAEHSAIAAMLAQRETRITKIVAVWKDGVLAPCGRCRELIAQVDRENRHCEVILAAGETATLGELLPHVWNDKG